MKLATYKDGSRDGQLLVVSRDLGTAHYATGIASKLQQVLDDWNFLSPQLQDLYDQLNSGRARHGFPFDPKQCMAPLPRAYQWADGSAYINHVELVRKARNSEVPESFYSDPLMYQGGSDAFLGPRDAIPLGDADWGCDMEGEIAVVTAFGFELPEPGLMLPAFAVVGVFVARAVIRAPIPPTPPSSRKSVRSGRSSSPSA